VRVLDEHSINSYVAPTIRDAREVLVAQPLSISMVFCEERLSDGSYSDLLTSVRATWPETRFVVMLCTGGRISSGDAPRRSRGFALPPAAHRYRSCVDPSYEKERQKRNDGSCVVELPLTVPRWSSSSGERKALRTCRGGSHCRPRATASVTRQRFSRRDG
jgi:hypothetical protein